MFLKPLIIMRCTRRSDILRFVGAPISRFYDALGAPCSLPNYHLSSRPDFVCRVTTSGIRSNWQFTVTDQVNLHRLGDLFRRCRPCRPSVHCPAYVAELGRSFEADLIFKQSASRRGFGSIGLFVQPRLFAPFTTSPLHPFSPVSRQLFDSLSLPLMSFSSAVSFPLLPPASRLPHEAHAYSNLGVASESGP